MNRFLLPPATIAFSVLTILISATTLPTAAKGGDLLSPVAAERLGLVESWHRQLGTIGGAGSIVDLQVWTERNKDREYVEVVRADKDGKPLPGSEVLRRIAADMKNTSGVAIGKKEAERLAELDVRKLKQRGIDVTIRTTIVKQVRLYMLGNDGGLSCYDAESGETLWSIRIGSPQYGYGTLGISDQYVTVLNGTTMYRIIADERQLQNSIAPGGRPLQAVRLDNVPIMGATNTDTYVVIPNTRNGIECYNYESEPGEPSFEMFAGQALAKPTRFPTSSKIGWTTDQSFFYLMETEGTPSTLFRLKTDGKCNGGATPASDDRFFFGSSGGRVYGVLATRSGEVIWNRSFGEPFFKAPFVHGEDVLISSNYGHLYNLSAADGTPKWAAPATGIDTVFAKAGNYYFGRTTSGLLTILDPESGQPHSVGTDVFVDQLVFNPETDRVYLVSRGGTVQCLRAAGSELPVFHRDLSAPVATESEEEDPKPKKQNENPFGGGEEMAAPPTDPFGAGAPATDPFGGGADPFGGGAADPFGGGADDPFK
jgi:hypothetical protein